MLRAYQHWMIFLNSFRNLTSTHTSQIRIFRKIFKISSTQRISMQICRWCKPDIYLFFLAFGSHSISKVIPKSFVKCTCNQHLCRPCNLTNSCWSIFIKDRLDSFFLHRWRDIPCISNWMTVCRERFSSFIKNSGWFALIICCSKWDSWSISDTK